MNTNVIFLPWVEPNTVPPTSEEEVSPEGTAPDDDIERALLGALTRRDMSTREVRAWLKAHGIDDTGQADWLQKLERLGYVNDRRMAHHLVTKARDRGDRGRASIRHALTARGLDREVIEEALLDLDDQVEVEKAKALAVERARRMTSLDPSVARRRVEGFLARRGFSSRAIREAVQHAMPRAQ